MSKKNPLRTHKKRQKEKARRKARMKKKLRRNVIVPEIITSAGGTTGHATLNQNTNEQVKATVKLHRLLNRLAASSAEDAFINAMVLAMLRQMVGGYRLAFPIIESQGVMLRCVALLAQANDRRLMAIRQLRISPGATHILVFLAFASEHEWLKQAKQIARLFPAQPTNP